MTHHCVSTHAGGVTSIICACVCGKIFWWQSCKRDYSNHVRSTTLSPRSAIINNKIKIQQYNALTQKKV